MWKVLKFLFTGNWKTCDHTWSIFQEIHCTNDSGSRWTEYVQKCDHCGKLKKFRC